MKSLFCALLTGLSFQLSAHSPSWSLEGSKDGWNSDSLVKMYFHNSELQRQWAWELLGKHSFQGNEKILDVGCGEGKVTAEISRLIGKGKITGVDISEEMIHFAKIKFPSYAFPQLNFEKIDSSIYESTKEQTNYDIICSFCVFHLVPKPLELLKSLKSQLKPTGKLMLVVPAGKNPAFFQAANETFAKYGIEAPWKKNASPTVTMRTLDGCAHFLKEAGFNIISLEMIDTDNPFYDDKELISWMVGNTTANWNIPIAISTAFFTDLTERMLAIDPTVIDEEGRLHFKLSRIHVIAQPN